MGTSRVPTPFFSQILITPLIVISEEVPSHPIRKRWWVLTLCTVKPDVGEGKKGLGVWRILAFLQALDVICQCCGNWGNALLLSDYALSSVMAFHLAWAKKIPKLPR